MCYLEYVMCSQCLCYMFLHSAPLVCTMQRWFCSGARWPAPAEIARRGESAASLEERSSRRSTLASASRCFVHCSSADIPCDESALSSHLREGSVTSRVRSHPAQQQKWRAAVRAQQGGSDHCMRERVHVRCSLLESVISACGSEKA